MERNLFEFIKGLVGAGKPLTQIQAESLVKEVGRLRRSLDDAQSRIFRMVQTEEDLEADRRYLHEKRHADGVKITALQEELVLARAAVAKACGWYGPLSNGEHCPVCGGRALETGEGHSDGCPYPAFVAWDKHQAAHLPECKP